MFKNILWLIPFFCFATGYFVTRSFFFISPFPVPHIEGTSLYEAVTTLSHHQLNLSLLHIQHDSDLPHGTIIQQLPAPGQMVKSRQTVFVSISEQPPSPLAPDMIGKPLTHIETELKTIGIHCKPYPLANSSYPKNTCFAQYPAPHQPITDNTIILYIAQPHAKLYLIPDFAGMTPQEATEALQRYNLIPEIILNKRRSTAKSPLIRDQRPLAGSIISLDPGSQPKIQLHAQ